MIALSQVAAVPPVHPLWSLPLTVLVPLIGLPSFWVASFLVYCVKCAIWGRERTPRIDPLTTTPWLPRRP